MITFILQLLFLTVIFFICLRYDLGKSFKASLSRAVLFGIMIGILYLLLQQSSIEGMEEVFDTDNMFKTIINKVYHTKLPMDKKWQDDNNLFLNGK
jgi:ABC-type lipoprotein release transport system permease subunit